MPVNLSAATTYTTARVTSKAITCGDYNVELKDGNLIYKKNKKTTTIETSVLEAFACKTEILYRTTSDVKIYDFKQDSIRNVRVPYPGENVTAAKITLAGFANSRLYYLDPYSTFALYKFKEGDTESVRLTGGRVDKFYLEGNNTFTKEHDETFSSQGVLEKTNYVTGVKTTLKKDVNSAYIGSKYIYYITHGDYTNTLGVGTIKIIRIDLNGKNKKLMTKIDNVDTNGYLLTNNKSCVYLGKDGNYHKLDFKKKSVSAYDKFKAEDMMKAKGILY